LAAAAYGLHAQLHVAMIAPDLGGKVSYPFALRNLPARDTVWGASLVRELEMRVRNKLDNHITTEVKSIRPLDDGRFEVALGAGGILYGDSVILATGARPQRIYVQGEMEYWGRGVSFSAISHAPFFNQRTVAVVGAGPRAVAAVLTLIPMAQKIYFIVSSSEQLRLSPASERALNHPKVVAFRGWEVQQVAGDEFVTNIDLVGAKGEIRSLDVDGVFIQLGLIPTNGLVRDFAALDEDGHVIVNERCETSVPGLFAAGDVSTVHAEQVPVSLGEGAKAALSAWSYLAVNGKV
ncbi:MAG: NAD(P)/FAD-dependent oxidoreductase, partial [Caldilineaceae bacterium]